MPPRPNFTPWLPNALILYVGLPYTPITTLDKDAVKLAARAILKAKVFSRTARINPR